MLRRKKKEVRRKENIEERHEEQRRRRRIERERHIVNWWKRDIARMMREREIEQDPN